VPPHPQVAAELTGAPFRGSAAVRAGLVSWSRLRSGCWRRLLPDVYAAASLPETVTLRARAAALVLPSGAAVTGSSAAWLHGVDVRTRDEPLDVTLPRGAAHAPHPSLRIRRALLTAADVTLAQAVPVTTPLRTAFDFARQPDEVAGMVGLDALLHAELVTAGQVLDFAAAHPGWRGVRRVPHRLALSEPATESPMESKLRLILINGGLPWPQAQLVVRDSTGRLVGRLDLGYPAARLGIEYDGGGHRDPLAWHNDLRRQNRLRAARWTLLRYTSAEVYGRPDFVCQQVGAVLEAAA